MKNLKKLLALVLALALVVTAFAACAEKPAEETKEESTTTETKEETKEEAEEDGTIHPMRYVQPGNLPTDYETGIAAVNEKLAADGVNIEVSIIRIPWDAYAEKLNLMLTTGEEFELLHVMQDVKNLSNIVGMGALLPVGDMMENYPDLYNKFTEKEWLGTLVNGEEYAVPCYWRSFDNVQGYVTYRADVAKAVGYEEFPETVDGIIDMMKKSQDYILEETGIKAYNWYHQTQDNPHWLYRSFDSYPFYVEKSLGIVLIRQDGTVDSYYESDEFKQASDIYYEMYQAGLVHPDVLSLDHQKKYDEAKFGAMLASQTFDPATGVGMVENGVEGADVDWINTFGDQPDMIYTFCQNLNAISSTSEDPESGIKFLDWLYKNEENHNLFHYGIEGVHYESAGDKRMEFIKDESGAQLYVMDTWMSGYLPYMTYSTNTPDDQIEYSEYASTNYVVSPAAGFLFDATPVASELTNIQTEIIASIYPIKFGLVSYEENIDAAIEKLKAAGLDRYLEEYRTQFAAYLEANPNVLEDAKGTTAG